MVLLHCCDSSNGSWLVPMAIDTELWSRVLLKGAASNWEALMGLPVIPSLLLAEVLFHLM